MYANRMFAWLAAGAIGFGASAAFAQDEPPQTEQLRTQIEQTLEQAYQQHGLDAEQARQQASELAGEVEQYRQDVQQRIQQTLEDEAQLDTQQAQQESERISQEIAQHLSEVGQEQVPAAVDEPQIEEEAIEQEEQAIDAAQQQSLQGTVIDAAGYLIHGEGAIQEQQEQQQPQQQQPLVLVTEEGEAYLIVERPMDEREPGIQPPLGEPGEIEEQQEFEQQQFEQEQEVEQRTGMRSPVRDRLAPRGDHGVRHGVARREQERDWEHHPGEWREEDPALQEQLLMDEPEQVEPAGAPESRIYQQLEVGQQFTLTGEVHERGGLRGIVIDEYGIERNGMEEPMEAEQPEPIEEPAQEMEEDLEPEQETEDVVY